MIRKTELKNEIESLRSQLEAKEEELWKINTKKWCIKFLEDAKERSE